MRVVGHLPRVPVGVEEEPRVAAPERRCALAADPPPGGARLLDHGVDLGRRADVVGERHAAPAAAVLDHAVLGKSGAVPERDHQSAGLEEHDVVGRRGAAGPAEALVERPRAGEVADAERYEADALVDAGILSWGPKSIRSAAYRACMADQAFTTPHPGGGRSTAGAGEETGARETGVPGFPGPFPVGRYAAGLREQLRKFARVCVMGEVTGARVGKGPNVYFELRDADGALPCAMWRDDF